MSFKLSFGAYQKTLVILKPDSFTKGADVEVYKRLGRNKLKVKQKFDALVDDFILRKLEKNYEEHKNKTHFHEWMEWFRNKRITVMLVEGEDAVKRVRRLALRIRKKYACNKRENILHSSNSVKAANLEIPNFFPNEKKINK